MQRLDVNEDNISNVAGLLDELRKAGPNSAKAIETITTLQACVGFRTCLMNIITRSNVDTALRFVATTYLKNGITQYFSKNMVFGIDNGTAHADIISSRAQERLMLKQMLAGHIFKESDDRVADFMSQAIASIVSVEGIQEWEAILPSVFSALSSSYHEASSSASSTGIPSEASIKGLSRSMITIEAIFQALGRKRIFRQSNDGLVNNYFMPAFEAWQLLITALLIILKSLTAGDASKLPFALALVKAVKTATEAIRHTVSLSPQLICSSPMGQTAFPKLAESLGSLASAHSVLPLAPETSQLRTLISDIRGSAASTVLSARDLAPLEFKPYLAPFLSIFSDVIAARATARSQKLHEMATHAARGRSALTSYANAQEANEEGEGASKGLDSCAVQALNFVTKVLNCKQYEEHAGSTAKSIIFSNSGGIQFNHNASSEIASMLQSFFNEKYIDNMIQMIVMGFLPWTILDLTRWEQEPEAFYLDQGMSRYDVDERNAAGALLAALALRRPGFVGPLLSRMISSALEEEKTPGVLSLGVTPQGEPSPSSQMLIDVLRRDAIFTAAGTVIFDLHSHGVSLHPDGLVNYVCAKSNALLEAAQVQSSSSSLGGSVFTLERSMMSCIALYRCAWLASNLNDVLSSGPVEQLIALSVRMFICADTVLRLQATYALKIFVDSVHFDALVSQFVAPQTNGQPSFLHTCIHKLLQLCAETTDYESRALALLVVREVVSKVGKDVATVIPVLVDALPRFWADSADENNLRLSIVDTLTAMVGSLEGRSQGLHGLLGDVLSFSTNPNDQSAAYLFDRGMSLWVATIKNAVEMTPALMNQFQRWIEIYTVCEDALEEGLNILESYVILGGESFLRVYSTPLASILTRFLKELGQNGLGLLACVIDRLAQVYPAHFIDVFPALTAGISDMCQVLLVQSSHGDAALPPSIYASFFTTFAHLFVYDPVKTSATLSSMPAGKNATVSAMDMLLDCWILYIDFIELLFQKKLTCMALLNIFALGLNERRNLSVDRVGPVLKFAYDIMAEEQEQGPHTGIDLSEYGPETRIENYRLLAIANTDPAEKCTMKEYTMIKLHEIAKITSNDFVVECINQLPASKRAFFS